MNRTTAVGFLTLIAGHVGVATAQDRKFADKLVESRLQLQIDGKRITGGGADLLRSALDGAQSVLIGELHCTLHHWLGRRSQGPELGILVVRGGLFADGIDDITVAGDEGERSRVNSPFFVTRACVLSGLVMSVEISLIIVITGKV